MDIISAYREVGSYRGAAAISGTTPKTVKRVIARHESGGAAPARAAAGAQLRRGHRAGGRAGGEDRRAGSPRSGCCRPPGRRATRGRRATSGGWSRRGRRCGAATITVAGGRRCGPRVSIWSSTGVCWAGCTCSARCWRGAGCGSCASPTTSAPTRRWRCSRSASSTLGGVPGVVLADRMGCLKGGVVANKVVPTARVRALRRAPRVPARLLRGRRPGVEGHRGEPGRLRQDRPDDPRPRRVRRRAVHRPRGGEHRGRGVVCRGQRRGALGDLRGAGRAAGHRAGAAGPAAVAAGQHRPVGDPQGRPALLCPVRLGALLGAGPAHRRSRSACTSRHDRSLSILAGPR